MIIDWMKHARNHGRTSLGRQALAVLFFMLIVFVLSGCMYPSEGVTEPKTAYRESVNRIQDAVQAFQRDQGILPMLNADMSTPKYEKFRVDLSKLKQQGYLEDIPVAAFENGGSAYFLIQNEETEPTVKVMDLQTVQKVNDVQRMVNQYKALHNNELPSGEELYEGLFAVDLQKAVQAQAGATEVKLNSVYSGQELPFMMDEAGNVFVDYAFDIMQAIEKEGTAPAGTEDAREVLLQHSYFVPVKSVAYVWENNTPIARIIE